MGIYTKFLPISSIRSVIWVRGLSTGNEPQHPLCKFPFYLLLYLSSFIIFFLPKCPSRVGSQECVWSTFSIVLFLSLTGRPERFDRLPVLISSSTNWAARKPSPTSSHGSSQSFNPPKKDGEKKYSIHQFTEFASAINLSIIKLISLLPFCLNIEEMNSFFNYILLVSEMMSFFQQN